MDSSSDRRWGSVSDRRRLWRATQCCKKTPCENDKTAGEEPTSWLKRASWWSTTISQPENIATSNASRNVLDSDLSNLCSRKLANHLQPQSPSSNSCAPNSPNRDCSTFVTPFAQILTVLRKARDFLNQLKLEYSKGCPEPLSQTTVTSSTLPDVTDVNEENVDRFVSLDESVKEIEWCLEVLDKLQWRRSVSSLAREKFCNLISRQLSIAPNDLPQDGNPDETRSPGGVPGVSLTPSVGERPRDTRLQTVYLQRHAKLNKLKRQSTWAPSQISEYIYQTFIEEDDEDEGGEFGKVAAMRGISKSGSEKHRTGNCPDTRYIGGQVSTIKEEEPSEVSNSEGTVASDGLQQELQSGIDIWRRTTHFDSESVSKYLEANPLNSLDIFHLDRISNHHPLTSLGLYTFEVSGLLVSLSIPMQTMYRLLYEVEQRYSNTAPFHNSIHATDVLTTGAFLLSNESFKEQFADLELFATYFACAVHDVDHPGLTNQHLINTGSHLAMLYNDNSVLENHHLAVAFNVLTTAPGCDVTAAMSKAERLFFRKVVIRLVLATDMSKHMTMVADFKTMLESQRAAGLDRVPIDTYAARMQILECIVHAADLSNPTKSLPIYRNWVERITEELFRQGDCERAAGMDISPMCDRHNAAVNTSQVGFIDFIVYPLWETLAEILKPHISPLVENIANNREWFAKLVEDQTGDNND